MQVIQACFKLSGIRKRWSDHQFDQNMGNVKYTKCHAKTIDVVYTMAEKGHDCKHSPFFFTITLVVFFLQNYTRRFFSFKITLAVFFFRITRDVFFRDDAIINYTRRFFNAILHATFFQCNNYTRRFFQQLHSPFFLELRFKLRVSLRMKMGAIIRLVCFIKTKNHVNTVQNFTFQSVNYEYNALFSFVFSKLYKQKLCVF